MARNATVSCAAGQWTELTNSENATGDISLALIRGGPCWIQATATGTEPSSVEGLPLLAMGDGWSEATIAEKFPEPASAVRLWAYPMQKDGSDIHVVYA